MAALRQSPTFGTGDFSKPEDPSLGGRPSGRRDLDLRLFWIQSISANTYEIPFPDKCLQKKKVTPLRNAYVSDTCLLFCMHHF